MSVLEQEVVSSVFVTVASIELFLFLEVLSSVFMTIIIIFIIISGAIATTKKSQSNATDLAWCHDIQHI